MDQELQKSEAGRARLPEEEVLRLNEWAEPAGWILAVLAGLAGCLLLFTDPASDSNLSGPLRPALAAAWLGLAFLAGSGARSELNRRAASVTS